MNLCVCLFLRVFLITLHMDHLAFLQPRLFSAMQKTHTPFETSAFLHNTFSCPAPMGCHRRYPETTNFDREKYAGDRARCKINYHLATTEDPLYIADHLNPTRFSTPLHLLCAKLWVLPHALRCCKPFSLNPNNLLTWCTPLDQKFFHCCLICLLLVSTCLVPNFYAILGNFFSFLLLTTYRGGLL